MCQFQDRVISVISDSRASDNRGFPVLWNISGSFKSIDVLSKRVSSVLAAFSTVYLVEMMVSVT